MTIRNTHSTFSFAAAAALFLAIPSTASAADSEPLPEVTLSDFTLGKHVSGEKLRMEDLKGKVTVIEFWGTR